MNKSVISTKEITNVLNQFGYKPNPVMFQISGQHIWVPINEPIDLNLQSKMIAMNELVTIKTISELKSLIKSKLKK